eukprot:scaffold35110_cov53-Cyclotella_meneghiniana.AAC.1
MAAATIHHHFIPKKTHCYHDGAVDRPRCWRRYCASILGTATARGPPQVNARWPGPTIHLRPERQGPWRPSKTRQTTQQSIGMQAGYSWWRRMGTTQQSAERDG